MENVVRQAERRGVDRARDRRHRRSSSRTRPTPPPAAAAPPPRSTPCARLRRGRRTRVVITNTKGFTGHAMGAGIEDVVAIKALETGVVPPVPNYKEPDPDLGDLNLSAGRRLPGGLRAAAGRRLRLADRHVAAAPHPGAGRAAPRSRASSATPTGSSTRSAGSAGSTRISGRPGARLEVVHPRLRIVDDGPAGVPVAGRRCRGTVRRTVPAVVAPRAGGPGRPSPRPSPAAPVAPGGRADRRPARAVGAGARRTGRRRGRRRGRRHRGRDDRLPGRAARPRPRPGGRPRRRHRQAGRGVRRRARAVRRASATTTWRCASSRPWVT